MRTMHQEKEAGRKNIDRRLNSAKNWIDDVILKDRHRTEQEMEEILFKKQIVYSLHSIGQFRHA